MKVEIKTKPNGTCEYFKIDNVKYGKNITGVDIKLRGGELPELIIYTRSCEEFILDSEDNKLFLGKPPKVTLKEKIKNYKEKKLQKEEQKIIEEIVKRQNNGNE